MKKNQILNDVKITPEQRINFASTVFSNVQQLIQLMDQKGAINMAIVTFLGTGLFTLIALFYKPESDLGLLKWALFSLLISYLVLLSLILYFAIRTFIARPNILKSKSEPPKMLFPLMLLRRFKESDEKYLKTLLSIDETKILADFANQIVINSKIYELKQKYVNRGYISLMFSLIPWTATIVIIIYIIFFKS